MWQPRAAPPAKGPIGAAKGCAAKGGGAAKGGDSGGYSGGAAKGGDFGGYSGGDAKGGDPGGYSGGAAKGGGSGGYSGGDAKGGGSGGYSGGAAKGGAAKGGGAGAYSGGGSPGGYSGGSGYSGGGGSQGWQDQSQGDGKQGGKSGAGGKAQSKGGDASGKAQSKGGDSSDYGGNWSNKSSDWSQDSNWSQGNGQSWSQDSSSRGQSWSQDQSWSQAGQGWSNSNNNNNNKDQSWSQQDNSAGYSKDNGKQQDSSKGAATGAAKGGSVKDASKGGAAKGGAKDAAKGGAAKGAAAAGKPGPGSSPYPLNVTTLSGMDNLIVQTLIGDYEEKGDNHERKFYKKVPKANEKVFLYYWDERDGPDFSGWWFGNEVGGTEVWAIAVTNSQTPPVTDWKVPWDSPSPQPGMLKVNLKQAQATPRVVVPAATAEATPRVVVPAATAEAAAPPKMIAPIRAGKDAGKGIKGGKEAGGGKDAGKGGKDAGGGKDADAGKGGKYAGGGKDADAGKGGKYAGGGKDGGKGGWASNQAQSPSWEKPSWESSSWDNNKSWGAAHAAAPEPDDGIDWNEKASIITDQVSAAENDAKEMIESARQIMGTADFDVKDVEDLLKKTQEMLSETQTTLTGDAKEAKAAGQAGRPVVQALMSLSPKLRTLQAQLATELKKAQAAAAQRVKAEKMKQEKEKRIQDASDGIAIVTEAVEKAEEAVAAAEKEGEPALANPPEQGSEEATAAVQGVDAVAKTAQDLLQSAKQEITKRIQAMGPGADVKEFREEYQALLKKLQPMQLTLNPLKSFKTMLDRKIAAKRAMDDIITKTDTVKSEVEQLAAKCDAANGEQMKKEDLDAAEKELEAVGKNLKGTVSALEARIRAATPPLKDELTVLREGMAEAEGKVQQYGKALAGHRKGAELESTMEELEKKAKAVEDAAAVSAKAVAPFLPGASTPTGEQHTKALSTAEKANKQAEATIFQARISLKKQLSAAKGLPESSQKAIVSKVSAWQETVEASAKKVGDNLQASFEKKYAELLGVAFQALVTSEEKVKELSEAAQGFGKEDPENQDLAELKKTRQKITVAEKAAAQGITDAKKAMSDKARESRSTGSLAVPLAQFQARITAGQQEITKMMKGYTAVEKSVRAREVLEDSRVKVHTTEEELNRIEAFLAAENKLTEEEASEVVKVTSQAETALKELKNDVAKHMASVPKEDKEELKSLGEMGEKLSTRVKEMLEKTKDDRNRIAGDMIAKEGEEHADKVEESIHKAEESELPFLSGMEELPTGEGSGVLAKCQEAAAEVDAALADARNFLRDKTALLKDFKEEVAKPLKESLAKVVGRLDAAAKKQVIFKADTTKRLRLVQIGEARNAVNDAVAKLEEMAEAVKPMEPPKPKIIQTAKDGEKPKSEAEAPADAPEEPAEDAQPEPVTAEAAAKMCDEVAAMGVEVQAKSDVAKKLIAQFQGDKDHIEEITKLRGMLTATDVKLNRNRKLSKEFEERFVAEKLLKAANEQVDTVTQEVAKFSDAAAPLIQHNGERFMVAVSAQKLAAVLRDQMKEKDLTTEGLFKQAAVKTDGNIRKEAFEAFLCGLYIELVREEVKFSQERRGFLYDYIASDTSKGISLEDFQQIMVMKYTVNTKAAVTDGLCVASAKTLFKVEVGTPVVAIGATEKDEATDMSRVECKILGGKEEGKTGWISLKGNQGTIFLQPDSPFTSFAQELDEKATVSEGIIAEGLQKLRTMAVEVPATAIGPLRVAKTELQKMIARMSGENSKIATLKTKVNNSKRAFLQREEAERQGKGTPQAPPSSIAPVFVFNQERPFYVCTQELELQSELKCTDSKAIRKVKSDELLEVLEEPKEDVQQPALRAKIKALSDNAQGYLTVRDSTGVVFAEKGNFHMAKQSVAMTSTLDVKKGKVVRKLDVGEVVQVIEGPTEDAESNILRIKARALKDDKEGWITPKGNAGTTFTLESQKHYSIMKLAPLEKQATDGGVAERELALEEVVEILVGPKESKIEPVHRLRCRALGDGAEGWFTLRPNALQPGARSYIALRATPIRTKREVDGKVALTLEVGQALELLEGPVEGPGDVLWIKVKAGGTKKGGWSPIRDAKGLLVQPCQTSSA